MMKVVAISGWRGSGKDTLASYMIEHFGAVRTSFADLLKDMVAEEYGIDRTSLDDPSRKESPLLHLRVNPRDRYSRMIAEFMITEFRSAGGVQPDGFAYDGDEFFGVIGQGNVPIYWTPRALAILKGSTNRAVRSGYWVKKAIEEINRKASLGNELHVIADLRYQSEMQQIRNAFGAKVVFIRINRFNASPSNDPSERDLDNAAFDFYVDNKGTKHEAYAQIDRILKSLI